MNEDRDKTAPTPTVEREHRIEVAIYWPGEGYGIPKEVGSLDDARALAREWTKQGYGTGRNRIRIIETTRKWTEWTDD